MYNFTKRVNRRDISSKWQLMRKIKKDVDSSIVPLSVADMEFETAPEIVEGLSKYLRENILGYTIPGEDYLGEVIRWNRVEHDVEIEKEEIVTTPGVVTALYNAIEATTEVGDGVIIFKPVYYPFSMAIENTGRKIVNSPLINNKGYYTIDFENFEHLASLKENKLLIISSPHNPVGRVWKVDELEKIVEICKRHNLTIVCDEIWNDIIMPGFTHTSILKITDYERVIVCTAASKTFNLAGLSTSNIIIPDRDLRKKFIKTQEKFHNGGVNALGLAGTYYAYRDGENWKNEMIEVVKKNYDCLVETLSPFKEITVSPLEGTYLSWVDLRSLNLSKEDLEQRMVDNNLFTDEGYIFGDEGVGFERFNMAIPTEDWKKSLSRLVTAINS